MKSLRVFLLLISFLASASKASAWILPSFELDHCAWDASHIVVVKSVNSKIDGVVEVLDSWKGDLKKGGRSTLFACNKLVQIQ
jgi:hypothetical protein